MRFNLRKPADLMPPERDEFASPDLEHLAAQLADDASFLAAKYPAPNPPDLSHVTRDAPPARRRLRWMGAAAATIAVAATLAISGFPGGSDEAATTLSALPESSPLPWIATPVALHEGASEPAAPLATPVVLYFDLTAPEKEAVLDLFEEEGTVASLSWSI